MTDNKRFNIIDDGWIGLEGSKYVTAIEDSDSPKKTVYFVYNANVKGVYRLLNQLNDENRKLKQQLKNEGYDDTFETRIIHSVVEDICYLIDVRIHNVLPKRYHQANMFNAASTELKNLKKDIRRNCE